MPLDEVRITVIIVGKWNAADHPDRRDVGQSTHCADQRVHQAFGRPGRQRPWAGLSDNVQATALVHEVYLRLVPRGDAAWDDRRRFVAIAAHVMREILIEHARSRGRLKRGGDRERVWSMSVLAAAEDAEFERWEDLDRALDRLAALDPRQASVVELRYFGGLTVEEAATVLAVSPKTVKRDWSVARAWLRRELDV